MHTFGEDGVLDAEPADQAHGEDEADDARPVASEPGPPAEYGGAQTFAHARDANEDRDYLQDHGAQGQRQKGVPESHAETQGGAQQKLGQRRELSESLDGHGYPGVPLGLGNPGQRVVVLTYMNVMLDVWIGSC
jgi:hypothetical protein